MKGTTRAIILLFLVRLSLGNGEDRIVEGMSKLLTRYNSIVYSFLSFRLGEVVQWAKTAKSFLRRCEEQSHKEDYAYACFLGCEAIEKGLKAALFAEGLLTEVSSVR